MTVTVRIDPRFHGPPGSGNGGYTCGVLAALVGEPAEVTLRSPPPLDVAMSFRDGTLLHGEHVVAEARRVDALELELPADGPPTLAAAVQAAAGYVGASRSTPSRRASSAGRCARRATASASSPARSETAASRLRGRRASRAASSSGPRSTARVRSRRATKAAARCSSGASSARSRACPRTGRTASSSGGRSARDGRKRYAGTAVFSAEGEVLARARATWIVPRSTA